MTRCHQASWAGTCHRPSSKDSSPLGEVPCLLPVFKVVVVCPLACSHLACLHLLDRTCTLTLATWPALLGIWACLLQDSSTALPLPLAVRMALCPPVWVGLMDHLARSRLSLQAPLLPALIPQDRSATGEGTLEGVRTHLQNRGLPTLRLLLWVG